MNSQFRANIVENDFGHLYSVLVSKCIDDPEFDGGILVNSQFTTIQSLVTKGAFKKRLIHDTLYVSHYGLSFPRNHFLYDVVSESITKLKSFGIIDYWTSPWLKSRYENMKEQPPAPKVLNMNHLRIGFEVCFCVLVVASIAFAFECIFNRIRSNKMKM